MARRKRPSSPGRPRQAAHVLARRRAEARRKVLATILGLGMALVLGLGVFGILGRTSTDDGPPASTTSAPPTSTTTAAPSPDVAPCPEPDGSSPRRTFFDQAPPTCIDPAVSYRARFETSLGTFEATLDPQRSPLAVNSFVFLARYHFYDGLPFHKVVQDFYAQSGDPANPTVEGPGYVFADDPLPEPGAYREGSLLMVPGAQPDQNGSQFLALLSTRNPENDQELPPVFPLFGQVTEGLDVLRRIGDDGGTAPAAEPSTIQVIRSMTIIEG